LSLLIFTIDWGVPISLIFSRLATLPVLAPFPRPPSTYCHIATPQGCALLLRLDTTPYCCAVLLRLDTTPYCCAVMLRLVWLSAGIHRCGPANAATTEVLPLLMLMLVSQRHRFYSTHIYIVARVPIVGIWRWTSFVRETLPTLPEITARWISVLCCSGYRLVCNISQQTAHCPDHTARHFTWQQSTWQHSTWQQHMATQRKPPYPAAQRNYTQHVRPSTCVLARASHITHQVVHHAACSTHHLHRIALE
jgi:hypothetical protein